MRRRLKAEGLNFEIKGRTKSISSIWNKMKKQKNDLDEIYDLFAIRIILDGDVFFAVGFRLVEFSGYTREHLAVGVFEREIFELAFYGVESEAMGEGSVKVAGFSRHMAHGFSVRMVVYGLHQCKTVHNHYDYDTYVVGESKEKFAEIVGLDGDFMPDERAEALALAGRLMRLMQPVTRPGDTSAVRRLLQANAATLRRDRFGLHPVLRHMHTAILLAERLSPDRNMALALMLYEYVRTGAVERARLKICSSKKEL